MRADALAQALAAATAISPGHYRARALTGLAPQLPAELLHDSTRRIPQDRKGRGSSAGSGLWLTAQHWR